MTRARRRLTSAQSRVLMLLDDGALEESVGMDLHAALWAFAKITEEFALVLVTDFIDLKGSLEVSRKPFDAYNASVTPKEIDPFIVRLQSHNQELFQELISFSAGEPDYVT